MTPEALIEGLRNKDQKAVERLLRDYTPILYNFGLKFIANRDSIPDLISETFTACLESIHRFEQKSSFKTWLIKIFQHKTFQLFKIQGREISFEDELLELNAYFDDRGAWKEQVLSWGANPEVLVGQKELFTKLDDAIRKLPPPYGQVVYLKDIEDLKVAEICNILGLSETNVRVILHRARLKLKLVFDKLLKGNN